MSITTTGMTNIKVNMKTVTDPMVQDCQQQTEIQKINIERFIMMKDTMTT